MGIGPRLTLRPGRIPITLAFSPLTRKKLSWSAFIVTPSNPFVNQILLICENFLPILKYLGLRPVFPLFTAKNTQLGVSAEPVVLDCAFYLNSLFFTIFHLFFPRSRRPVLAKISGRGIMPVNTWEDGDAMLCEVRSLGLTGISGYEVRAECDLS